ncbi:MAG: flagellar basal body L-ring protein FlgH [Pseudomonadota bacterium]
MIAIDNFLLYAVVLVMLICAGCTTKPSVQEDIISALPTNPNVVSTPLNTKIQEREPVYRDPDFTPVRSQQITTISPPTGSLFNPSSYRGLFSQKRIYQIGDMILVELDEETKASTDQKLRKDKDSDVALNDFELRVGPINVDNSDVNFSHEQVSNFNSNARASRSNTLEGSVNVFVRDVLENGNLIVSGEKWIKLSEGEEFIRVEGEIRIADIEQKTNSISSSNIGNAKIEYSGNGEFQENQEPTLIGNILSVFQ